MGILYGICKARDKPENRTHCHADDGSVFLCPYPCRSCSGSDEFSGITALEDKSLGCTQKGGTSPVPTVKVSSNTPLYEKG